MVSHTEVHAYLALLRADLTHCICRGWFPGYHPVASTHWVKNVLETRLGTSLIPRLPSLYRYDFGTRRKKPGILVTRLARHTVHHYLSLTSNSADLLLPCNWSKCALLLPIQPMVNHLVVYSSQVTWPFDLLKLLPPDPSPLPPHPEVFIDDKIVEVAATTGVSVSLPVSSTIQGGVDQIQEVPPPASVAWRGVSLVLPYPLIPWHRTLS